MIKLLCVRSKPEWGLFKGKTYTLAGSTTMRCNCGRKHGSPVELNVSEIRRPSGWVMRCRWCRQVQVPQPEFLPFHPRRFIQLNDPSAANDEFTVEGHFDLNV